MRTTCGALVIKDYQQILACHPTKHHPNQWDIVKGCVDKDEDYRATMHREFLEETGIYLEALCSVDVIDYSVEYNTEYVYRHKNKKLHGFVCCVSNTWDAQELCNIANFKCTSMVNQTPSFPEIDAFAWIDICDIAILHESQQRFVNDVMENTRYLQNAITEKRPKSHYYG